MSRVSIANIVAEQLPEHLRCDYPQFVAFMEAYYTWLHDNNIEIEGIRDIDVSLNQFEEQFRNEFMRNFPTETSVDRKFILKNIKDLYLAKGSEASYKFLFKILADTEVSILYPSHQMLRLSDSDWIQERSIFVSVREIDGEAVELAGKQIDIISGSNRITIEIDKVVERKNDILELFLANNLNNQVSIGDQVVFEPIGFVGEISPTVQSLSIVNGGSGFRVGETYTLDETTPDTGSTAKVLLVDTNGGLQRIQIINFSTEYSAGADSREIMLSPTNEGNPATINLNIGVVSNYEGYYQDNRNFLSSDSYIQDGEYYQIYSYVLKINETFDRFRDVVKEVIHPAGMALFGETVVSNELNLILDYQILGSIITNAIVDTIIVESSLAVVMNKIQISEVEIVTDSLDFVMTKILATPIANSDSGFAWLNPYASVAGADAYFTNTDVSGDFEAYVVEESVSEDIRLF